MFCLLRFTPGYSSGRPADERPSTRCATDCRERDSTVGESLTTLEKAGKRADDPDPRDGTHEHSTSGGLDEGLKRARGEYRGRGTDSGKRGGAHGIPRGARST